MQAFTLRKSVVERLKGIQELQDEHFLVKAEETAADQGKGDALQFLSYSGIENLRDARTDVSEVVGLSRFRAGRWTARSNPKLRWVDLANRQDREIRHGKYV